MGVRCPLSFYSTEGELSKRETGIVIISEYTGCLSECPHRCQHHLHLSTKIVAITITNDDDDDDDDDDDAGDDSIYSGQCVKFLIARLLPTPIDCQPLLCSYCIPLNNTRNFSAHSSGDPLQCISTQNFY